VLYYYEYLDPLLVEAHAAGVARFCDERNALIEAASGPPETFAAAIRAGLPSGPDDASMRLLFEVDVLAGASPLHEELMQKLNRRQRAVYLRIVRAGIAAGVFVPVLTADLVAQTLVALEDCHGIHIVADRVTTHDGAVEAVFAVAAGLGCPTG